MWAFEALSPGKFREPDVVFYLAEHADRVGERYGEVPDLVIEVLSPTTAQLDRETKSAESARAGIREYWLVVPDEQMVEVFVLSGEQYTPQGQFRPGQKI